jgi:hypothetical protein
MIGKELLGAASLLVTVGCFDRFEKREAIGVADFLNNALYSRPGLAEISGTFPCDGGGTYSIDNGTMTLQHCGVDVNGGDNADLVLDASATIAIGATIVGSFEWTRPRGRGSCELDVQIFAGYGGCPGLFGGTNPSSEGSWAEIGQVCGVELHRSCVAGCLFSGSLWGACNDGS